MLSVLESIFFIKIFAVFKKSCNFAITKKEQCSLIKRSGSSVGQNAALSRRRSRVRVPSGSQKVYQLLFKKLIRQFSWLECRPVTAEVAGSSPVRIAKSLSITFQKIDPVVQLVRMPPCHGGGRGFESRPDRKQKCKLLQNPLNLVI